MTGPMLPPVLILSTGRCGSTMVSDLLNRHPAVLSLSEFFVPLGSRAFRWSRPDGARMWRTYAEQSPALHAMLKDGQVVDEMLYPLDAPGARYGAANLPPIMMVTLPHLTDQPEALFDELAPFVSGQPAMPLAEHYHALFGQLAARFGRRIWAERSGGSLMLAAKLLRLFPEARVIHVYRDGRDTAMSMAQHHNFRVLVGAIKASRRFGLEPTADFTRDRVPPFRPLVERLAFSFLDIRRVASNVTLADLGAFWSRLIMVGEEVLGQLPPERLFNLRFEDLQRAPRETLRDMIRFMDPSLEDAAWLDAASAVPRPARSKFANLPPAEQAALTAACAPGLEALGYPI
ncbi:sulfotransferase [Roseococcus sp. SDR]|uniref:sulfotransferase n=1 Tax=Roseococcus sp. SDR TaxID=2835532 RepID=UPI001BD0E0C1|nr:sulfotransferase [Roseococcus sp. SDR]MBS7792970.1 sulfotransferase [Roseococcus sp. SDR]MBV1848284.1 sulfotransferase [Roseococcus sp. SDR]